MIDHQTCSSIFVVVDVLRILTALVRALLTYQLVEHDRVLRQMWGVNAHCR